MHSLTIILINVSLFYILSTWTNGYVNKHILQWISDSYCHLNDANSCWAAEDDNAMLCFNYNKTKKSIDWLSLTLHKFVFVCAWVCVFEFGSHTLYFDYHAQLVRMCTRLRLRWFDRNMSHSILVDGWKADENVHLGPRNRVLQYYIHVGLTIKYIYI